MKQRVIAILIMLSVILATEVGCSRSGMGISKEGLDPITFSFYSADGSEDPWTDPVALEITRKTGVTIETDYPVDGDDSKISLMIASKEYPDIIFAKGDGARLIEAGALIDMIELIDEYGPNIKKMYGKYYDRLKYSESDNSIYQLCSTGIAPDNFTTSGTAQLQWAVLAEHDYKIPYTLEDYEQMIKSYMKKYPTYKGKDAIGITISCSDWHWYTTLSNPAGFIANGSPDNGQWIIDEENGYQATYKHSAEGQKEYFQWLNRMFNEGVLDPDFATQTHDEYIEKIASGRVLGLLDADWDYASAEMVLKAENQYDRTYAGLPVTLNEDITCQVLRNQGLAIGWGVGITTSCEDPIRAIQFLDYLCSEEGQILVNWGIEDVNYFVDGNGKRYRAEEEIHRYNEDTNYKEQTGVGFHNYPFPSYGTGVVDSTGNTYSLTNEEMVKKEYNSEQKKALAAWGVDRLTDIFPQPEEFSEPKYAPVWAKTFPEEITQLEAQLNKVAWAGLIDCIVAKPEEFDLLWKQMQMRLDAMGRSKAEAYMTNLIQRQVRLWSN